MSREVNGVIRLQLVSPGSALLWQDVGGPLVCAGAIGVTGRLVIVETGGAGVFQAEVGIQTFTSDMEVASTPSAVQTQTAGTPTLGFKSGVSKNFFSFDPTVGNNGDITKFLRFRLGLLYNTTTAAISRAEVLFEHTVRYA